MLGSIFANSSSDQKSSRMLRDKGTNGIDLKNEECFFFRHWTSEQEKPIWTLLAITKSLLAYYHQYADMFFISGSCYPNKESVVSISYKILSP